jgi:hypothetical protein
MQDVQYKQVLYVAYGVPHEGRGMGWRILMTPLEELQHVLFGQLMHGNPTSDLECMLDALREAKAQGLDEAVTIGSEQSPHHTECALKWAAKCRARAAAIRKGEA